MDNGRERLMKKETKQRTKWQVEERKKKWKGDTQRGTEKYGSKEETEGPTDKR